MGRIHKTFFVAYEWSNKLECLSLAGLSNLRARSGAFPRGMNLKGVQLRYASALLGNITLGWKGLPETNTPAYSVIHSYEKKVLWVGI